MPSPLRLLHLDKLPDGSLATPISLSGQEGLSQDFKFHVQITTQQKIKQNHLLGKPLSIALQHQGQTRYFHGVIESISAIDSPYYPLHGYSIHLVPQVTLLSLHHDCRQYQQQSVIDIARFWFQYFGISQVDFSLLKKTYPKIEYVVQYNESVWHFLKRLFAEYGIFYYYTFTQHQHQLVLADSTAAYQLSHALWPLGEHRDQHVQQYTEHHQPSPTAVTLINSSANRSGKTLRYSETTSNATQHQALYPRYFDQPSQAKTLVALQHERQESFTQYCTASTNITTLEVIHSFCIKPDNKNQYLITQIQHDIKDDSAMPIKLAADDSRYQNQIVAIPTNKCFRPSLLAAPTISGTHTAMVTGPKGEEIYTNDKGQIKVQFHWDRHSLLDQNSSCWIRLCHDWASKGFGFEFVPRIGQEVLVQYENGDINKPIVVGSVYNSTQLPPYTLPQQASFSGFKTHSFNSHSKAANEIRLDDTAQKEMILVHAKRNLVQQSKRDHLVTVGGDHHVTVDGDFINTIQQGFSHRDAKQKLVLEAGPSSIVIDAEGIVINAPQVNLNDSEPVGLNHPDNATHWVQAHYISSTGQPVDDMAYTITHADGTATKGKTDSTGKTDKLDSLQPGTASIEFGEREKLLNKLQQQRQQLKQTLDAAYNQANAKLEKKLKKWHQEGVLHKTWDDIGGALSAVWHCGVSAVQGIGHFFWQIAQVQAMSEESRGINMRLAMGEALPTDPAEMQRIQTSIIKIGNDEYTPLILASKIARDKPSREIIEDFLTKMWLLFKKSPLNDEITDSVYAGAIVVPFIACLLSGNEEGAAAEASASTDAISGMMKPVSEALTKEADTLVQLERCQTSEDQSLDRTHKIILNETPKGAKGPYSKRDYDPAKAGGPLKNLVGTQKNVKITQEGINTVRKHTSRFPSDAGNEHMIQRLQNIANGKMMPDDIDKNFYTHEIREYERYSNLGWPTGNPSSAEEARTLWNNAHTATLEEYGLTGKEEELYQPVAIELSNQQMMNDY